MGVKKLPRENLYKCGQCGGYTVTVDVDKGTTPFSLGCLAKGGEPGSNVCAGIAYSSMYPKSPRPEYVPAPAWEWYRASEAEVKRLEKQAPGCKEHHEMGGLFLRKRTDAKPVYHGYGGK